MKTKYTAIKTYSCTILRSKVRDAGIVQSLRMFVVLQRRIVALVIVAALLSLGTFGSFSTTLVSAQQGLGSCEDADGDPSTVGCTAASCEGDTTLSADGSECVPVSQIDCDGDGGALNKDNCQIVAYLIIAINFLTAVAGVAIVGGMVYGGYLYLTARDNPGQVQSGRSKIVWSLVALLMLIFGYAALQWLVPGGVLNGQAPEGPL